MREQNSRSGTVDSDILQSKADVLRAVQASAARISGNQDAGQRGEHCGMTPIRVNVRPVIAVRAEREQPGSPAADTPHDRFHKTESAINAATSPADMNEQFGLAKSSPSLNEESEPAAAVQMQSEDSLTAFGVPEETAEPDETRTRGNGVPQFKLAEQILAEQRRAASGRRQRAGAGDAAARTYAAQDTVGAVIREVKYNLQPSPPAVVDAAVAARPQCSTAEKDGMTPLQREIIEEIVARDIALFSSIGRRRTWPANKSN